MNQTSDKACQPLNSFPNTHCIWYQPAVKNPVVMGGFGFCKSGLCRPILVR